MDIHKWFKVRKYRLVQALMLMWKRVPVERQKLILYIGNYVVNAAFISFLILYITYWGITWFRFIGIIPAVTIFLFYFEHYYKWLRVEYKD